MEITELDFVYPETLVATERRSPSRIMVVRKANETPCEIARLAPEFAPGDCLVINNTRVCRRRVFSQSELEILFLSPLNQEKTLWHVLCPSSRWKPGTEQILPGEVRLQLLERGRPQTVESSLALTDDYFDRHGELPLPPYIQKARKQRHNLGTDESEYQTAWAEVAGSLAAPTASLHFTQNDLEEIRSRGVDVGQITLHVGLGTFLPVTVTNLEDHVMHSEWAEIPQSVWEMIQQTKKRGGRVWAMGTTVARTLESAAHGLLKHSELGFSGDTQLFIRPGFEWRICDVLLTNFHQPRSTLLSLVAAFSNLNKVKSAYAWAIERQFRLFSYGDLTVWFR